MIPKLGSKHWSWKGPLLEFYLKKKHHFGFWVGLKKLWTVSLNTLGWRVSFLKRGSCNEAMINSSWIWLIHLKLQWTLFWVNGTPSWNPCLFCPFKRLSRQSLFLEFWFLDISFQDLSYFCQVESHEWHFFSSKNPPHPSPHKKKKQASWLRESSTFTDLKHLDSSSSGWKLWWSGLGWVTGLRCLSLRVSHPWISRMKTNGDRWKVLWEGTLESSVQIHWGALFFPAS